MRSPPGRGGPEAKATSHTDRWEKALRLFLIHTDWPNCIIGMSRFHLRKRPNQTMRFS